MSARDFLPVLTAVALLASAAQAQDDPDKMPPGSWTLQPGTELSVLWSLVERKKGWATGTRTVVAADGARTVHTSFLISGRAWRCVERQDRPGRATKTRCYRLQR